MGSGNAVAPVNAGTSTSSSAHRKLRVVAAHRSGSPKSSTRRSRVASSYERLAGSSMICALSAIV